MKLSRLFHGVEVDEEVAGLLALRNVQAGPLLAAKIIREAPRTIRYEVAGKIHRTTYTTLVLARKPWIRAET